MATVGVFHGAAYLGRGHAEEFRSRTGLASSGELPAASSTTSWSESKATELAVSVDICLANASANI